MWLPTTLRKHVEMECTIDNILRAAAINLLRVSQLFCQWERKDTSTRKIVTWRFFLDGGISIGGRQHAAEFLYRQPLFGWAVVAAKY